MPPNSTRPETNRETEQRYDEYVMPVWKSLDVPVERAQDCTLVDFDGNEYLDLYAGISVVNVGHRNEAVVEAAKAQLDAFVHGSSYVHPNRPVAALAERLAEVTPGDLRKSFFCNSGTEAVEGAVKLARKYTGRKEVVGIELGFHGRTMGSLALTGNRAYKDGMAPTLNDVSHAAPPYALRCQICPTAECTADCAADVERVIDAHTSGDVAAVVVEPVMGEGGIVVPPAEWLHRVRDAAHDRGALLIVDEVQTGFGRTGAFWAVEHFDLVPDVLTQAKGIANGLPLGAFTASAEVADAFEPGDHNSTFGGNPVAAAAALAVLDQLEDGLVEHAREEGDWLADELGAIAEEFAVVGQARGLGLMHGLELVDPDGVGPMGVGPAPAPDRAKHVAAHLREDGIVVGVGGFHRNVVRVQPPLTIERPDLERAVDGLRSAVAAETGE